MESRTATIDELDRLIIHVIQLQSRAPFALIADVLGVSEQTVARRYRRLHNDGVLRVLALANPAAAGLERWLLRIRCRPDSAAPLAEALARRADVSWLSLAAGGSEVICTTRTTRGLRDQELLLHRLPNTARVEAITAYSVLHQYGLDHEWSAFSPGLSVAQQTRLAEAEKLGDDVTAQPLTPEDGPLLTALGRDGRASLRTLAEATGWSPARVGRRLDQLRKSAAIYLDVDLDVEALGFTSVCNIWATVAPRDLETVGRTFASHPEVAYCAAITGTANLTIAVLCRNSEDLYRYVTTRVGAMEAVRQVELSPAIRVVKQAGTLLTKSGIARIAF